MSTLKQRKEQFVTGLEGGSIQEVNLITSLALTTYFCWKLINSANNDKEINPILDFALNWISLLLSLTIYADDIPLLSFFLVAPCLTYYIYSKFAPGKLTGVKRRNIKHEDKPFGLVKKPYITAYRSGMLILTCIAILAVDFPIFPRRFAKVETWGTSLMDLGVGSFVFSNGLVSTRSLLKSTKKAPISKRLISAFRSGGTLLGLGLLRLYFVKNLEYQEHVTEYGVHWNFFITLSLLPIILVLIDPIAEIIPRFVIALVISGVYEWYLVKDDTFLTYLILADRTDIFSSNREGIVSFVGYCAIFLWGQSTGLYLLGNVPTLNNLYKRSTTPLDSKKKYNTWDRMTTVSPLTGLFIWFIVLIGLGQITFALHPLNISRRFANLPYTIWVVAYNLGFLAMYCAIDKLFQTDNMKNSLPLSLESMNTNGLILFLLANISTGLINMSMSTLDAGNGLSMAVLIGYCAFMAAVSMGLFKYKIFIRL